MLRALNLTILAILLTLSSIIFYYLYYYFVVNQKNDVIRKILYYINTYMPNIHLLFIILFTTYITNKILEYQCNKLYTDLFSEYACQTKIGFKPNSPEELIAYNSGPKFIPASQLGPTKEAICIVHGTAGDPNQMKKIYKHFEDEPETPRDIFVPLLKFHKRKAEIATKFDFLAIAKQLEEDINYIAIKYKKIYCIGHSLGGALLFYLSLQRRLPKNIYIILYAPSIDVNISCIMRYIASYAMHLNPYLIYSSLPFNEIINNDKKHNFMDYFLSWNAIVVLYDSSYMIKKMLDQGAIPHNYFTCILCENDDNIPLKESRAIFDKLAQDAKHTKYMGINIAKDVKHSPHTNTKTKQQLDDFLKLLNDDINKLSAIET